MKNEIWGLNLAYVDKLAKNNNSVKYVIVPQDLFDGTVDAKKKENKRFRKTVTASLTNIIKKNRPEKILVDKVTEFAGEFKKLAGNR